MNFNEAISSRDRYKGCLEPGFVFAVKQAFTELPVSATAILPMSRKAANR